MQEVLEKEKQHSKDTHFSIIAKVLSLLQGKVLNKRLSWWRHLKINMRHGIGLSKI